MSPSGLLSSLSRRFRARNNQAVPQIRPRVPQKRPSLSGGLGKESSMDWLTTIDASKALYNVHIDILGDWYRDPWSWAELDWVVKKAPEILSARLNEKGSRRAVPLDVPKENFAIRPALLLDPVDRLCYQALVDRLSVSLIGDLRGWAYGWRLSRTSPKPGGYLNNKQEWSLYRLRLRYLAAANGFGLETDITSFFSSVDVNRLADNVQGSVGNNAVVQRLRDFL